MEISKAMLIERYRAQIENTSLKLSKHAAKLAATPVDAMRWADATFTAAAEHSVASALLVTLTADSLAALGNSKLLKNMQGWLLESIQNGAKYPPRSTSVSSNMIEQELLAAKAKEYEVLCHYKELVD